MKKRIYEKTTASMLVVLLCSIVLIASLFLPYFTALDEYKELLEFADQKTTVSLYDFFLMLMETRGTAILLGILSGLSFFTALFAFYRQPIVSLVFGVLVTAATVLLRLTFNGSSVLDYYTIGIGRILMFTACAGLLIGAIWMIVGKAQAKKTYVRTKKIA